MLQVVIAELRDINNKQARREKKGEKLDVKQFPYVQFILNQTLISFDINFLHVFLFGAV